MSSAPNPPSYDVDATFPTSKLARETSKCTASRVVCGSLIFIFVKSAHNHAVVYVRDIKYWQSDPKLLEQLGRSNAGAPMFLRASNSFGYLTVEGYRGHVFPIIFSEVGSWMATVRGPSCTLAPAASCRHLYAWLCCLLTWQ